MTNEREAKIDAALAEHWAAANDARATLARNVDALAGALKLRKNYRTKTSWDWVAYDGAYVGRDAILALAEKAAATEKPLSEYGGYGAINFSPCSYYLDKRSEAETALAAAKDAAAPLEAVYEAERWNRFFLVTNADGHIHSSLRCSTCHPTTSFVWLPELSGLTEADAVAAYGPKLCSVCFPTAPVEWTLGNAEEKAAKKAAACSGSGAYVTESDWGRRYATCHVCGKNGVNVTRGGKLRMHEAA